jgi:hypothetical protein
LERVGRIRLVSATVGEGRTMVRTSRSYLSCVGVSATGGLFVECRRRIEECCQSVGARLGRTQHIAAHLGAQRSCAVVLVIMLYARHAFEDCNNINAIT